MAIPAHVVPRQSRPNTAEHDRATLARQLLLGRYLDPWGTPDIAWCHSHTLVRGYKVLLNVYDLLPRRLNGCLSLLRLGGAFHSGVQVGATEYAFGGHPNDDLGITVLKKPLFVLRAEAEAAVQNDEDRDGSAAATLDWMPTLRSRVVVGWWMGPLTQLDVLLRELRFDELWVGSEYRLLSRNCNHFARAMLSGMLRNPLFKAAPGCSRPEDMLPRSLTRLPALVLALGSCAPCLVRRLNAPLPLAPHSLNTFQGQGRRARLEGQPARLAPADRQTPGGNGDGGDDGGRGGGGTASQVSVTMTAGSATTAVAVLAGVRPSSSSVMSSLGVGGDGGRGGVFVTAAAAAAEGRTMRLTARFQSLRLETTPRASMEGPARNSFRRGSEDGSGGVAGGGDGTEATGDDASTTCSSSDLAAGSGGGAAAFYSHNPVGNGQTVGRCTGSQLLPPECTSAGSGNLTETTPDVSAVVPPFAAVYAQRTGCSLSLHPPSLIMEPSCLSASSSSSVTAAAATNSVTSPGSHRAPNMHRFLSTSRSGRRVFPDPRAILGQEQENVGGGDAAATAAHESSAALIPDGGGAGNACHVIQQGVGSPVQDELEMTSSTSQLRDADASRVFRPSATMSGSGASPWPSTSPLSKSQQVHCKPRYSGGDLPALGIMPLLGHDRPLPPPQSQLLLQMPQQSAHFPPSTLLLRGTAITADGAAAAATSAVSSAGGAGARHHSPTDVPHPWSILSGGFVNLLFSPSASTEPPTGVPHRVAISSTATSAGGRRISSLTGDGASIFSASSSIAVGVGGGAGGGCLATVNSGDLSDDGDDGGDDVVKGAEDLQKAVVRTRASTGTLGISLGGRRGGSTCGGSPVTVIGMVTPTPTSDLAAAAAPGSNLLWPTGPVRRVGTRVIGANGLGAHPFLFSAAVAPTAAAAVAVVADEAPAAALTGRKAH